MTTTTTPREIAAGFALAGFTLCLGTFLATKAGDMGGTALMRISYALAVLFVLKFTFAWGRYRGFPARGGDGSIAISNVVRNLVMAAIVWAMLLLFIAPLVLLSFNLAR